MAVKPLGAGISCDIRRESRQGNDEDSEGMASSVVLGLPLSLARGQTVLPLQHPCAS